MYLLTTAIPYLIPKMLPCVQAVLRRTVATGPCLWDNGWGCCAIPPGHCCSSHFTWLVQDPGGWWEARKLLQSFDHHHLSLEPIKSCSPLHFLYYCVCLVSWVCLPKVKLMYLVEMESMFDKHSFVSLTTKNSLSHACLFPFVLEILWYKKVTTVCFNYLYCCTKLIFHLNIYQVCLPSQLHKRRCQECVQLLIKLWGLAGAIADGKG